MEHVVADTHEAMQHRACRKGSHKGPWCGRYCHGGKQGKPEEEEEPADADHGRRGAACSLRLVSRQAVSR